MLGYPELFTIIYHKTQGSWLLKIASNLSTDFAFANIQTRGQQLKFESTKLFPKIYFVPSSLNNALTQQVRWVDFQTSDKFYQFIIYRYAHQECQLMKKQNFAWTNNIFSTCVIWFRFTWNNSLKLVGIYEFVFITCYLSFWFCLFRAVNSCCRT